MKHCTHCAFAYSGLDWRCPSCGFAPPKAEGFTLLAPELVLEGAGFHPEAYAELATLETGNFWFRARNQLIIWAMQRHFPNMQRYLEIGCGTGFVLAGVSQAYPQAQITGSEIFSTGLPYALKRVPEAELLQMDARHLPYENEFDLIGAFDVLEHIEEDEVVLSEMKRALRSTGGIILTVPQHPHLWSQQDEYACHVRRYKMGELRHKVKQAGFRVVFETSFVSLLLPAMAASRLWSSKKQCVDDEMAELRLPKILNSAFETVMGAERFLIRMGVRFPLGGSDLLVAKK